MPTTPLAQDTRRIRQTCNQGASPDRAARPLRSRPGSALIERPNAANHTDMPTLVAAPEPWVTKQQLADHLGVTRRWVESQQQLGLPYLRLGSINRYSITEVEEWLRERYAVPVASWSE